MIHMFSVSVIETPVNDLIPNILIVPNWTGLRKAVVKGLISLQSINCKQKLQMRSEVFVLLIGKHLVLNLLHYPDELQFW